MNEMEELNYLQKEFIKHIAETGALKFGRFTLVDGRESPYYFNLAEAMSDGQGAHIIVNIYARAIKRIVGCHSFDYIYGPAYKGIALVSLIAYKLWTLYGENKRWGYDRKEAKEHGDKKDREIIVGDIRNGDRVIIVNDTIAEGGTKVRTYKKLQKEIEKKGIEIFPVGIFVGIHREELSEENKKILEKNGIQIFCLVTISQAINYLYKREIKDHIYVGEEEYRFFWKYFKQYGKT